MQSEEHARHPWRIALALCCALLLIFGATIQVAHVHTAAKYLTPAAPYVQLRTWLFLQLRRWRHRSL